VRPGLGLAGAVVTVAFSQLGLIVFLSIARGANFHASPGHLILRLVAAALLSITIDTLNVPLSSGARGAPGHTDGREGLGAFASA